MSPASRQGEKELSPSSQDGGLETSRADMGREAEKEEAQGGLKSYLVR